MNVMRPSRRTRLTNTEASPTPVKIRKSEETFSVGAIATSILAIVALIGLFLTMAGYGVALSVETQFGMPHASIFKSNFDLISLSVWFIVWSLTNFAEMLESIFLLPSYWKSIGMTALIGLACCLIVLFIVFAKRWLIQKNLAAKLPNLKNTTELKFAAIFTVLFSGVFTSIAIAMAPLLLCVGLLFCSIIGMVPALSTEAGESHIRKFVVGPTRCMPTLSREQRIANQEKTPPKVKKETQEYAATCVKVLDSGQTIASGRVVFSTTELIVLYDPGTGKVTRESTSGRSIEVVSKL